MTGRISGTATSAVVDFIARDRSDELPGEVSALSKRCVIDGVAVMLAGATTPASKVLRAYAREQGSTGLSTVVGQGSLSLSPALAALVNGTSGHALDFDDTQLSTSADRIFGLMTHPTIPPLVAALAVGEPRAISGRDFLDAFATGFEVECKIAEAIHPDHYKRGFHSSGTVGTFGAVAATARIMGLDRYAVSHALATAASLCAGIRVNFGTMTKPLHVGRAGHNGVTAAELASKGFTGGADALDGPWGFFTVFSFGGGFDADRIVGKLGNPYTIVSPGVSIKPYPCGVLGHPSMDAMRRLVARHDIKAEAIRAIRLRAGSNILNPLRYATATSELEAKFCPAFMLASIALRRKAGIHEFTDEFVRSPAVQQMMSRVETIRDPHIEAQGFERIRSTVEVDLFDGQRLSEKADERYRGGPDLPFTQADLHEKFNECAELLLPKSTIAELIEVLESLEELEDIRQLTRLLWSAAPASTQS